MPPKQSKKDEIKGGLKNIFKSLDYVSQKLLGGRKFKKGEHQELFNIYQQLGLAWEFLGLQCKHWDGFKKTRSKKKACKICGKIKGVNDSFLLIPIKTPSTTGFTKVKVTGDVVQPLSVTWSFDRENVKKGPKQ